MPDQKEEYWSRAKTVAWIAYRSSAALDQVDEMEQQPGRTKAGRPTDPLRFQVLDRALLKGYEVKGRHVSPVQETLRAGRELDKKIADGRLTITEEGQFPRRQILHHWPARKGRPGRSHFDWSEIEKIVDQLLSEDEFQNQTKLRDAAWDFDGEKDPELFDKRDSGRFRFPAKLDRAAKRAKEKIASAERVWLVSEGAKGMSPADVKYARQRLAKKLQGLKKSIIIE